MKDVLFGNDYFEASFTRLNGNTDYKSSSEAQTPTCFPCGGTMTQNHGAQTTDIHVRYGRGFILNDELMITPYAEIGHHEWKRNLGLQIATGTLYGNSVSEEYNHSYFSVGSLAQYSPTKDLVFSLNGSIGSTFMASISGKGFGYVPGACGAICGAGPFGSQDLGNDLTYKLSLSTDYAFTKNIHANAGINYTEFRYGKSDLFNFYNFEPDSKTSYAIINVGLGYAF
jgi:opacity protein-like surface antigen